MRLRFSISLFRSVIVTSVCLCDRRGICSLVMSRFTMRTFVFGIARSLKHLSVSIKELGLGYEIELIGIDYFSWMLYILRDSPHRIRIHRSFRVRTVVSIVYMVYMGLFVFQSAKNVTFKCS